MKEFCNQGLHVRTEENTGKGNKCLECKSIRRKQDELKVAEDVYYQDNVHYRDTDMLPWESHTDRENEERIMMNEYWKDREDNKIWEKREKERPTQWLKICHICGDPFPVLGHSNFRYTCKKKLCIDINYFSGYNSSHKTNHKCHFWAEAIKHYSRYGILKHIEKKKEKHRSWKSQEALKQMRPLLNVLARASEMHCSTKLILSETVLVTQPEPDRSPCWPIAYYPPLL